MSEYKRLTGRNADGTTWVKCSACDNQDKCDITKESCCNVLQDRLAELEDKIEQGTLKEEKTCENVSEMHPVDVFTCSECGISLEDYCEKEVDEENGDITYREYMLRYCPNCGAKVVY